MADHQFTLAILSFPTLTAQNKFKGEL